MSGRPSFAPNSTPSSEIGTARLDRPLLSSRHRLTPCRGPSFKLPGGTNTTSMSVSVPVPKLDGSVSNSELLCDALCKATAGREARRDRSARVSERLANRLQGWRLWRGRLRGDILCGKTSMFGTQDSGSMNARASCTEDRAKSEVGDLAIDSSFWALGHRRCRSPTHCIRIDASPDLQSAQGNESQ